MLVSTQRRTLSEIHGEMASHPHRQDQSRLVRHHRGGYQRDRTEKPPRNISVLQHEDFVAIVDMEIDPGTQVHPLALCYPIPLIN